MARCYYATRLSENISETPEGYLICQNVPIARTGWQEYSGTELKLSNPGIVQVYRDPNEVFSEACLSSFESKAVTDLHPSEWLDPNNTGNYQRGHVRNVRRGVGEFEDCIVADLVITDANLIAKIRSGIREVSCGYDCIYTPLNDELTSFSQSGIRGNHLAIVSTGRAGERIAIRDSKPNFIGGKKMAVGKDLKKFIWGLGFKAFVQDAEPEAVANAIEAAHEGEERREMRNKDALEVPPQTAGSPAPTEGGGGGDIGQALMKILSMLEQLMAMEKNEQSHAAPAVAPPAEPEDALDALAAELEGQKPPIAEDAGLMEPVMTLPPEDRPKNPIPGAEKSVDAATIRALKPIIAGIKNKDERQKVVDALMASHLRPGSQQASYGNLLHFQAPKIDGKGTTDSSSGKEDIEELGRQIKEKYHRKPVR